MKVVLQQDVKGQGKKGQVVNVSDGYARNYLLPRKLAVEATRDVLNAIEKHDEAVRRRNKEEEAKARVIAKNLKETTVRIKMKSGGAGKLYGSVTNKEIGDALAEQFGLDIDRRKIVVDEPIKTYGTHEVKVKLFPQIVGTMYVMVTE